MWRRGDDSQAGSHARRPGSPALRSPGLRQELSRHGSFYTVAPIQADCFELIAWTVGCRTCPARLGVVSGKRRKGSCVVRPSVQFHNIKKDVKR